MEHERKMMEIQEQKKEEEASYIKRIQIGENIKVRIVDMLNRIDEEKFLTQIYIILKRHIEKRGG